MFKNRILLTIGITLSLLFNLFSCHPAPIYLQFEKGNKRHDKLTLKAINADIELEILGRGWHQVGMYKLYLSTSVSSEIPIEELSFRPDSIQVYIGKVRLNKENIIGGDTAYLKTKRNFYRNGFYFNCSMIQATAELLASKSNKIKFVFDDFIIYEGKSVNFDTVYGADNGELADMLDRLSARR